MKKQQIPSVLPLVLPKPGLDPTLYSTGAKHAANLYTIDVVWKTFISLLKGRIAKQIHFMLMIDFIEKFIRVMSCNVRFIMNATNIICTTKEN